jgi:single-stranded DNA-binding protein
MSYLNSVTIKGSHVLVEGSLVSTTYERGNGRGKKAKTNKQTFWCIRADVVRKLDRGARELGFGAAGLLEGVGELQDASFAKRRAEDLQAHGQAGRSGEWRVASGELEIVSGTGLG